MIDNPAPADVRPGAATVGEDVLVVAPGVLQRVGQDGHGRVVAGVVHLSGDGDDGTGEPGRIEGDGAGGVAEQRQPQPRASCRPPGSDGRLDARPDDTTPEYPIGWSPHWMDVAMRSRCGRTSGRA